MESVLSLHNFGHTSAHDWGRTEFAGEWMAGRADVTHHRDCGALVPAGDTGPDSSAAVAAGAPSLAFNDVRMCGPFDPPASGPRPLTTRTTATVRGDLLLRDGPDWHTMVG
jgi:hypothetical protein